MNDLAELKDGWGEPNPPSRTAEAEARAALMRRIAAARTTTPVPGRPRRRGLRFGWLTGAAVTAALAAAVAVAVIPGTTRPGHPSAQASGQPSGPASGRSSGPVDARSSGRQILLAAATIAEERPASTGTYWHLRELGPAADGTPETLSTWIAHDGTTYDMPQGHTEVVERHGAGGFQVGHSFLTFQQLQQLPTDPTKLKDWITDSFAHPTSQGMPVAPVNIPASEVPGRLRDVLVALIWQVPAPPAVRAAVFRALAAMPDVTNLGTADGGVKLRISFPPPSADKYPDDKVPAGADRWDIVIDPKTSMPLSLTTSQGTIKILSAGWTDDMPKLVSPPSN